MKKFEREKHIRNGLSTVQTIALGFFMIIVTGSFLLTLPVATADGISTAYIDALFTATTSVCVTGLVTVTTAIHWSAFGKFVIMMLIQIGGLGFMTAVTMVFAVLRRKMSVKGRLSAQDSLNESGINRLGVTVRRVILGTFLIESIGALLITISLSGEYSVPTAAKYGIFTAISAFCNAGIDIMSMDSLVSYHTNGLLLWTVMGLIVIGGIGFPIWWEALHLLKQRILKKASFHRLRRKISLHFKLVVITTLTLIVTGALITLAAEYSNPHTMGDLSLPDKITNAFFQSVTTRTAGFDSLNQIELTNTTKLTSMLLMFVGGSPGSTAGGIKTVTFATIVILMMTWIRGGERARVFKREIPDALIRKAFLITALSMSLLFVAIMILVVTEGAPVMQIAYECVSALATVGLSLNFTPTLSTVGKVVIIMLMFMGRIGPITLFLALNKEKKQIDVHYPEEKILIG